MLRPIRALLNDTFGGGGEQIIRDNLVVAEGAGGGVEWSDNLLSLRLSV